MQKSKWLVFSSVLVGAGATAIAASAQGNVSGYLDVGGGSYSDVDYQYLIGSARFDTASPVSLQFDAMIGRLDDEFAGGLAGHLLWELTSEFEIGAFASAMKVDAGGGIEAQQIGVEGSYDTALYTLSGYVGQQFEFRDGVFGGLAVTYYPLSDLSIGIEHSFDADTDGMTSVNLEKRFGASQNSYAFYANAGYVYDSEQWNVGAGLRVYLGNSNRRDFVSRGAGAARPMATNMMAGQFRSFMRTAAQQTQDFNDGIVE